LQELANLEMSNQLKLVLKLESKDLLFVAFQQKKPQWLLTVKFRQPRHEFTFGVDMSFILYPLVLTPLV
jgi:hypothetical protein